MQGISPSASNLGARARPSSTCSTVVRAAKGAGCRNGSSGAIGAAPGASDHRCVHVKLFPAAAPGFQGGWALAIDRRNVIALRTYSAIEIKPMTLPSTQPRPCTDSSCRGQHAPAERVALAMSLCSARGVRLTELRRQILELLWESGRPAGAYELIEALKASGLPPGRAAHRLPGA